MRILTTTEKNLLVGSELCPDNLFNPVQDINGDWFISEVQVNQCTNPNFQWVKELPVSEFTPKPSPINI